MIKAVIFDLDYTLHDDHPYWLGTFREVAEYLAANKGIDSEHAYEILRKIFIEKTYSHRHIFDDAFAELNLDGSEDYGEMIRYCVHLYREHEPTISLYPEIREVLDTVKNGYRLGLLTNGTLPITQRKLRALQLEGYFEQLVCPLPEDRKPSERPFLEMATKLGLSPDELAYVGDNPVVDFIGAKKVQICTIRVLSGPFEDKQVSEDVDAEHTIANLSELPELLEKLS